MTDLLLDRARAALAAALGREPRWAARAPGRVNLIGEHTDYNEGLVLPLAIDRGVCAAAAPRPDGRLRIHSETLGASGEVEIAAPVRTGGWLDYVAGVAAAFGASGLPVPGLDVALASDLPREAGLSSSAALEVCLATLFDAAAGLGLAAEERARLAHAAETDFVGVPCGRMDQLASALGRRGQAVRIDCRDFATRRIPLAGAGLLVVDSGVRRQLVGGEYRRRREECERGFARARDAGLLPAGARAWRDVAPGDLARLAGALSDTELRRARHVVTENGRVDETCAALARGDAPAAGACLRAGMRSLRDDFEVSCPELDTLCTVGDATPGCHGSRLTGAGFGGCTIHLVEPGRGDAVAAALRAGFAERHGREPSVWAVRAADGAAAVPLG